MQIDCLTLWANITSCLFLFEVHLRNWASFLFICPVMEYHKALLGTRPRLLEFLNLSVILFVLLLSLISFSINDPFQNKNITDFYIVNYNRTLSNLAIICGHSMVFFSSHSNMSKKPYIRATSAFRSLL